MKPERKLLTLALVSTSLVLALFLSLAIIVPKLGVHYKPLLFALGAIIGGLVGGYQMVWLKKKTDELLAEGVRLE